MAQIRPEKVTVRMYQMGFGDSFLITLHYPKKIADAQGALRDQRHLLIDFGSTHSPVGGRLKTADVATQIGIDSGGKLDVVVVTHRHKDHLSGFGNSTAADTLEALHPDLVVRPWTEDPDIPARATSPDHPVGLQSRRLLRSLAVGEQFANELATAIDSKTRGLRNGVRKLADEQLKNAEAVERLAKWSRDADGEYLHAGMASKIGTLIPGLTVDVLGPPTVDQFPDVVNARARDPEYWMLYKSVVTTGLPFGTLHTGGGVDDDDDPPTAAAAAADASDPQAAAEELAEGVAAMDRIPAGPARWLADRLRGQQVHSLQRIVRSLDDALNNTSLILLLKVGDRNLLLPGDAQIENWRFTLDKLAKNRSPALKRRLEGIDLYKVGHHGSRNATPRSLLGLWGDQTRPTRLVSLLSTRADAHGDSEATAVPRATLVTALQERTDLFSTEGLAIGDSVVVEAPARGPGGFTRTL